MADHPLQVAADRYVLKMADVVLDSVGAARDAVDLGRLESTLARRDADGAVFALEPAVDAAEAVLTGAQDTKTAKADDEQSEGDEGETFAGLARVIFETLVAGASAVALEVLLPATGPPIAVAFAFDVTNPEAVAWIKAHAAELVTGVTAETKTAIRAVIQRSFEEGIPPKQAAHIIRGMVGLTERDAIAAQRRWIHELRQAAREAGDLPSLPINTPVADLLSYIDPKEEARLARRYETHAAKLHRRRALLIAQTETMTASNRGQLELWRQAVNAGSLRRTMHKIWIVSELENMCPICEGYRDIHAPVLEPFAENGLMGPPAHPMCHCTYGLIDDPTPRAYVYERDDLGRLVGVRDLAAGVDMEIEHDAAGRVARVIARQGA